MATNPRVWCKFTVKHKNADLNLRIQDMPDDRYEDVINLFVNYFATGETFHKIAGVSNNINAIEECRELVKHQLKVGKVVICCVDAYSASDSVGDVIAAGIMVLNKKGDPEGESFIPRTKEIGRLFKLMDPIFESYNAMKKLGQDSLYDGRGVVVHPDYRGLGICRQMFHVRRLICKEEGVPITVAWMTGYGSQKAAERDGWETVFTLSYEELGKSLELTFDGVPSTCNFMVAYP